MTISPHDHPDPHAYKWTATEIRWIEQKIAEARSEERERCAKFVENKKFMVLTPTKSFTAYEVTGCLRNSAQRIADAIRKGE